MRENFQSTSFAGDVNTNKILFNIKKFNNTSIELTWNNNLDNTISKYIIIKYVNTNGPYLTVVNNKSNRHIIDNIHNNIIYKIGIVSIGKDKKISNLEDNIKEFSFSIFNDTPEVKYVNSFKTNVYCDPNGQHKIGKCPETKKNNIIATYKLNEEGKPLNYFNDEIHENLMDYLTKPSKNSINFELKI